MFDLLISNAYAQAAPGGSPPPPGGGGFELLLFFGSIIGIWYFLVIRPQTKQQSAHRSMVAALKRGDQVITSSGLHGKVAVVDDTTVTLEVSKGVKLKFNKDKVAALHDPAAAKAAAGKGEPAADSK